MYPQWQRPSIFIFIPLFNSAVSRADLPRDSKPVLGYQKLFNQSLGEQRRRKQIQYGTNDRFGSKADLTPSIRDVRFTPETGHGSACTGCPFSANRVLTHRSK